MPRRFPRHIPRNPILPSFTICVLSFIAAVFAIASLCAAGFEVGIKLLASSQPGSTLQPVDLRSPSRELEGDAHKNRIRKLKRSDFPGPKNHHAVQPNFTFQQKLIQAPAEGVIDDQFGVAVAVSGNTAVVGAYNANVGANLDQGAVYVFTENGGVWSQQQKLTASDGAAGDGFGVSVAIHGDILVVGAYADDTGSESDQVDRGAAYIFNRSGNGWNQQQKLTGLDSVGGDLFGFAVAVNADTALIGSPLNDEVALDGGGAYVFTRSGTTWTQQQKLLANDTAEGDAFGISVAIEANTVAMGALRHDVGSNNNQGAAYVFTRSAFSWSQQQKLAANDGTPNDQFGVSVGISGDSIIVGANFKDNVTNLGQGAAYIFSKSTGAWTQQQKLLAADGTVEDGFGTSVAISGDTAVVGSSDDDLTAANQGSVYAFARSGSTWTEEQNLFAADGAEGDFFASYVAIDGLTIVAGAPLGNVGADTDQGAAYIFQDNDPGASLPLAFIETQISGISSPTAMALAPDGRIFVCEQPGALRVIKNGVLLPTPFVNLTVSSLGERGLLGVAFDPDFSNNQFVYVYYTATTPAIHNRVSRFTANGDVAVPGSELVILDLNNLSSATNHNGGAIHFGPDRKLYVAVGENANAANAQSFGNLLGKMLRINTNPADLIPTDNPYFNDPNVSGINKAIWALGLRNPFTFGFQPGTDRLFINDVGQDAWEEVNEGLPHSNYGWPTCEGPSCSANPPTDYRAPIYVYNQSTGTPTGCAIVGAVFYNPPVLQFPAIYVGKYFFADLCSGFIRFIDPTASPPIASSTSFATGISTPVDLQVGDDGSLYYLTRGSGGSVFRIQYSGGSTIAINDVKVTEGNSGATIADFTVNLSPASSQPVTVQFTTADGTATAGLDYLNATGTITFMPGQTAQAVSVTVNGDNTREPNENFFINLSGAVNATIDDNQGVGTINNDDPQPQISINDVALAEGNAGTTAASFTVSLSAASSETITVQYATANGTATGSSDYVTGSGTVTFTPSQTSQPVTVTVNGDTVNEPNETFFVNLSGATNASISDSQGQGTIVNDDMLPPTLEFSHANFPHDESSQSVIVTVRRSGNLVPAVTIDFKTNSDLSFIECSVVNGQANQRCDYLLTTGTLLFAPNELEKSFTIVTFNDAFVEDRETFSIDLSNPTGAGAVVGPLATATVTIQDDDVTPPTTNPIDTSRYFIRQNYYDFLQRVPDQGGEDFWIGQIDQLCALGDAVCINRRRVAVSAAFFVSSEFTRSGGFVYRLYKAAFGEQTLYRPLYAQFSPDRARVVDGADLEQGKLDLANLFVQRSEFTSRYGGTPGRTPSEFVEAILQTVQQGSGVTFNATERQNFINDVTTGGRGLMLKNLADNAAFTEAVFNRAFVLMQYFGYLRRDPDQGGYEFWLGILNASAQNFDGMVCAFITSAEYQRRFSSLVTRADSTCQ